MTIKYLLTLIIGCSIIGAGLSMAGVSVSKNPLLFFVCDIPLVLILFFFAERFHK